MNLLKPFLLPAVIAIAACSAPNAAADPTETPRTITVTGAGEAKGAPDMAIVTIGVNTEAATASEALRQNGARMQATIAALKDANVEDRDIQTSGLSVNPRYEYDRSRSVQKLNGFTASNSVTVRLRDLDRAGAIIDSAIKTGANTLNGVRFSFSDPKPLRDQARTDAVKKAGATAKLLTDAAGVRLGPILSIQEGYASGPSPLPVARVSAGAAESYAAPIEAGESAIRASVTIVYQIN